MKRAVVISAMTFLLVIPVFAFKTEQTVLKSVTARYALYTISVNLTEKDVASVHTFTDIALALSFEEIVRLVPYLSVPKMIALRQATNQLGDYIAHNTQRRLYPLMFPMQRGPAKADRQGIPDFTGYCF